MQAGEGNEVTQIPSRHTRGRDELQPVINVPHSPPGEEGVTQMAREFRFRTHCFEGGQRRLQKEEQNAEERS